MLLDFHLPSDDSSSMEAAVHTTDSNLPSFPPSTRTPIQATPLTQPREGSSAAWLCPFPNCLEKCMTMNDLKHHLMTRHVDDIKAFKAKLISLKDKRMVSKKDKEIIKCLISVRGTRKKTCTYPRYGMTSAFPSTRKRDMVTHLNKSAAYYEGENNKGLAEGEDNEELAEGKDNKGLTEGEDHKGLAEGEDNEGLAFGDRLPLWL
ncbi:uncharacterized protein P884DRAFT_257111 [Thermothelomyces heterothallicus CBS 202.75]|uniref:uncharacterized protein n=1 Tax=Thermothelomyces heterothallicus CBS 202.75 TaxID=1149848 RepID=UPI0037440D34